MKNKKSINKENFTAEEFLKECDTGFVETLPFNSELYVDFYQAKEVMLNFARICVKKALQKASEESILSIDGITEKSNGNTYYVCEGNHYSETVIEIDKNSILNSYDLNDIK